MVTAEEIVGITAVNRVAAAVGGGSMAIAFVHRCMREADDRAGVVAG